MMLLLLLLGSARLNAQTVMMKRGSLASTGADV
jgi:hypothetical protein